MKRISLVIFPCALLVQAGPSSLGPEPHRLTPKHVGACRLRLNATWRVPRSGSYGQCWWELRPVHYLSCLACADLCCGVLGLCCGARSLPNSRVCVWEDGGHGGYGPQAAWLVLRSRREGMWLGGLETLARARARAHVTGQWSEGRRGCCIAAPRRERLGPGRSTHVCGKYGQYTIVQWFGPCGGGTEPLPAGRSPGPAIGSVWTLRV
jgi:hypothetical protein